MGDCCSDTMKFAGRVAVGTATARGVNAGINAGVDKYNQHHNKQPPQGNSPNTNYPAYPNY